MRLWIRADASRQRGLGHVMRTVALAEQAQLSGVPTTHLTWDTDDLVADVLTHRGLAHHRLEDPENKEWVHRLTPGDIVVFDGYDFNAADHRAAASAGAVVGAIDDLGIGDFAVEVLTNAAPPTKPSYRLDQKTTTLFGPRYALVRAEFVSGVCRRDDAAARLLITLGGTSPPSTIQSLISSVEAQDLFQRVTLIVGPAADVAVRSHQESWLRIVQNPRDIAPVFRTHDAAISAAGTTAWELLALGVPTALIAIADNQQRVLELAVSKNAAIRLRDTGEQEVIRVLTVLGNPRNRERLANSARRLVDGFGAARVWRALANAASVR